MRSGRVAVELALSGEAERFARSRNAATANFTGRRVEREVGAGVVGEKDELVRTHACSVLKGV